MNWFVLIALTILLVLFFFLGFRITGIGNFSWYASGTIVGLVLFYPLVWYGVLDEPWDRVVRGIIHFDLGMLSLMIALLVVRDFTFLPLKYFRPEIFGSAFSGYSTAALGSISLLLLAYGFWNSQRGPEVVRVEIPIAGLPADLENYAIVQISDLHAGAGIDQRYVESVVAQIEGLQADVVVLTGDIADGDFEKYKSRIDPLFKLTSKLPVLYVTGNHEYLKDSAKWIEQFAALGAHSLMNAHTKLVKGASTVLFAGVIDPGISEIDPSKGPDVNEALVGSMEANVRILLAHQPNIAEVASDRFDIQLSGHTHAGQFFPWNLLIKLLQPYSSGLNRCGKMWVYTNSGTGYWGPPFRIGTRSEITLLVLKGAE